MNILRLVMLHKTYGVKFVQNVQSSVNDLRAKYVHYYPHFYLFFYSNGSYSLKSPSIGPLTSSPLTVWSIPIS